MKDDTISRQAAIEVIDAVFPVDPMKSEYAQGIACGAALAKTYVEQLPPAQPELQWIPCSERLPEEENKYLCTCSSDEDDEMFVLSFHKNLYAYDRYVFEQYKGTVHPGFIIYDSIYGDDEVDVLAWMPLPKPYRENTDE